MVCIWIFATKDTFHHYCFSPSFSLSLSLSYSLSCNSNPLCLSLFPILLVSFYVRLLDNSFSFLLTSLHFWSTHFFFLSLSIVIRFFQSNTWACCLIIFLKASYDPLFGFFLAGYPRSQLGCECMEVFRRKKEPRQGNRWGSVFVSFTSSNDPDKRLFFTSFAMPGISNIGSGLRLTFFSLCNCNKMVHSESTRPTIDSVKLIDPQRMSKHNLERLTSSSKINCLRGHPAKNLGNSLLES